MFFQFESVFRQVVCEFVQNFSAFFLKNELRFYYLIEKNIMAKNYRVTMHITPELKVYIGMSHRQTWRYEGHYRGSGLEPEAARFGWHNINHVLVADNLKKQEATEIRRRLIEKAGAQGLNRTSGKKEEPKKLKIMKKEKQTSLMTSVANGVKLSLTFDNRYHSQCGYPVVVRVYNNRKWTYVPLGYAMEAEEFRTCSGETLASLEKKFSTVKEWCVRAVNDGTFNFKDVKKSLEKTEQRKTLVGFMEMKRDTLEKYGTKTNYTCACAKILEEFPDGLPVEEINPENLKKIMSNLKKEGKSDATVNVYMSAVKSSLNYAIYKGMFESDRYPFKKCAWEMDKISLPKSPKRRDRWISADEISTIWNDFVRSGDKWLGLFLFSYLTGGMNLADMMDMRWSKEMLRNDVIRFVRKKTEHKKSDTVTVPVCKKTKEIFQIMGLEKKEGELVFPFLSGDYYKSKSSASVCLNRALGKYGITMTYARHSFSTNMSKLGAPFSLTEAAMGHSLGGVASHYIAPYTPDEMLVWFEKLL